ncbi:MAG: DUF7453 family protein [Phycisphaerales bacterium]
MSIHSKPRWVVLALPLVGVAAAQGGVSVRAVAYTGAPTPVAGTTYAAVSDPVISERGVATFWARLAGEGVTTANDGAWLSDRSGALSLVAREGAAFEGATVVALPSLAMNDTDVGLLVLSLQDATTGSNTNLAMAFSDLEGGAEGTLQLVARDAAGQAPTYNIPGRPAFAVGRSGYWTEGLAIRGLGSPDPIVTRSPVPGIELLGGAATWRFNGLGEPGANDLGELVFWGAAGPNSGGGSANAPQKTGLWRRIPGEAPRLLVGEGQQVVGSPIGQMWSSFGSRPVMVGDGSVVVWGKVAGTGVTTGNETSLMHIAPDGRVSGRVDAGEVFPGAAGERFGAIPQSFSVNFGRGDVAIVVPIRGAAPGVNTALLLATDGERRVLARRGDQAPGLVSGVVWDHFQKPAINDAARVAFVAMVRGEGVNSTNNTVLYATTRDGGLTPVVRTGDLFVLPDGPAKTIRRVIFQEESASLGRRAYTLGGQIIFGLEFTDNTEAIVVGSIDCLSDFNADGGVDGDDIIAFFTAWDAGLPSADVDGSGSVDADDTVVFFAAWDAGC